MRISITFNYEIQLGKVRIEKMLQAWISTFIAVVLFSSQSHAQGADAQKPLPDPRYCYDFGVQGGSILPSRMGLTETVPGWGMRLSYPSEKGVFEGGVFSGIGHGIVYRSATVDYRMDVAVESIQAHFLLGVHADQYDATSPVIASSRFAGGWHYGGGLSQYLAGPLYMRFDFRHRFSPGQILEVTLGLVYRLPAGGQLFGSVGRGWGWAASRTRQVTDRAMRQVRVR